MEYRFSMTPRLLALAVTCLLALMALMFMLGFTLGEKEVDRTRSSSIDVEETRSKRPSPGLSGNGSKPVEPEAAAPLAPASGAVKQ
jgi:hypothetical protein